MNKRTIVAINYRDDRDDDDRDDDDRDDDDRDDDDRDDAFS